jgi:sugar lactone lactonase YvrE
MTPTIRSRFVFAALVSVAALGGWKVAAQTPARAPAQVPDSQPNPYRTIENWAQIPAGRTWGSASGIDIDPDGKSVWIADRCAANGCLGSNLPMIFKFDSTGKVVKNFGAGEIVYPHGLHVDRQGNVWVVDGQSNRPAPVAGQPAPPPPAKPMGMQVVKFSPDGQVLMRLGTAGEAGTDERHFNQPSDVITSANGDIFVADGHGDASNARIVKFDKSGKFIKTWGRKGAAPGDIDTPHSLAMDSRGRLYEADRFNDRIQIFDQDGKWLGEMRQFSRPSGVYIDKNDILYAADSESNKTRGHDNYTRGVRVGRVSDGIVTAFIRDPLGNQDSPPLAATSGAEGLVADVDGNIYTVQVQPPAVKKFVKK